MVCYPLKNQYLRAHIIRTMTELDAIKARHSVRKYMDKPIEADKVEVIRATIEDVNALNGLNIQLVLDEPKAFASGMWKYGQFSGVRYYFVMAGPKGKDAEEKIGYYGEKLALLAPTAINQQKFRFILREGNKVETKTLFSMAGYTNIDLGIAKYHFEVAAGKENFSWL